MLEEGSQILGSTAASVLVAGLVVPYIAALSGRMRMAGDALIEVAVSALAVSFVAALAAMALRGLARVASDDDVRLPEPDA